MTYEEYLVDKAHIQVYVDCMQKWIRAQIIELSVICQEFNLELDDMLSYIKESGGCYAFDMEVDIINTLYEIGAFNKENTNINIINLLTNIIPDTPYPFDKFRWLDKLCLNYDI